MCLSRASLNLSDSKVIKDRESVYVDTNTTLCWLVLQNVFSADKLCTLKNSLTIDVLDCEKCDRGCLRQHLTKDMNHNLEPEM